MNETALFANQTISMETFLKHHWQKRPYLFKNTELNLSCLPTMQDLFDIASQADVQSRIVFTKDSIHYQAIYDEPTAWNDVLGCYPTLLVSDIEKWRPETKQILQSFPFIKSWRLDDLMVSFAPTGASVGAHIDHYDVFLIQIKGTRLWSYDDTPVSKNASFVTGSELSVLADYQAKNTHELKAGDVLYLPPEIAHHGISTSDDCMTCSIGMRAPSEAEMVMAFAEWITQKCEESNRFKDQGTIDNPFAFDNQDVIRFKKQVENALQLDDDEWTSLFGHFFSQYRQLDYVTPLPNQNNSLRKNPFFNFQYIQQHDQSILFVNGDSFEGCTDEIKSICHQEIISDSKSKLIQQLLALEYLI